MSTTMIEKRDAARQLAAEGKTYRQIAEELDLAPVTVYSWIPTKAEQSQFKTMADLRASGMTNVQIAERTGVSPKRVSAVLGPAPRRRVEVDRRQIRMEPGTFGKLKTVARTLGLPVGRGEGARSGSVGRMLDAIARGEIDLCWRDGFGPDAPAPREEGK